MKAKTNSRLLILGRHQNLLQSSHCFRQTANQLTSNTKLAYKMEKESQWIEDNTHHIHHAKRNMSPPVHLNNVQLPPTEEVSYLGLHLDRRLT
jgi:hypothetical protein